MVKRKVADLSKQSLWDEELLLSAFNAQGKVHLQCNGRQLRLLNCSERGPGIKEDNAWKVWNYLLRHPETALDEIPFQRLGVPRAAQAIICGSFHKLTSTIAEAHTSSRGDTTKLLIELQDGHRIEAVIMRHAQRCTVCISSQIGCKMGCKFCATGTMGIVGNLTAGEIIEQVVHASTFCRVRNIVFMGMGEPLNNYPAVKMAIRALCDVRRFSLSPAHVTVSTVGVIPRMRDLTNELPQVNLALSLHAGTQEVREQIVPTATAYPLHKLMEAVEYHIQHCKRSSTHNNRAVMMEYILIRNVNDREQHAHDLGKLLQPLKEAVLLNLIPYNPTDIPEQYEPPTEEDVRRFHQICISYDIYTKVRQEMGQDIAGACGQLALTNPSSINGGDDGGTHGSGLVQDIEDLMNANQRPRNAKQPGGGRRAKSAQQPRQVEDGDGNSSESGGENDKVSVWRRTATTTTTTTWLALGALAVLAIVGLRALPLSRYFRR
jgi:sorting nexin-8